MSRDVILAGVRYTKTRHLTSQFSIIIAIIIGRNDKLQINHFTNYCFDLIRLFVPIFTILSRSRGFRHGALNSYFRKRHLFDSRLRKHFCIVYGVGAHIEVGNLCKYWITESVQIKETIQVWRTVPFAPCYHYTALDDRIPVFLLVVL